MEIILIIGREQVEEDEEKKEVKEEEEKEEKMEEEGVAVEKKYQLKHSKTETLFSTE